MVIIGNKSDRTDKTVSDEEVKNFTERYGIDVIEASAKSSHNIETAMKKIAIDLMKKAGSKPKKSVENTQTYKLNNSNGNKETATSKIINKCNCK